jgi:hypothetical protein
VCLSSRGKKKKKNHVPDAKSSLIWWHASNQLTRVARRIEQLLRILYGGVKIFYGGACASKGHGAMPTCAHTNQYIYIYATRDLHLHKWIHASNNDWAILWNLLWEQNWGLSDCVIFMSSAAKLQRTFVCYSKKNHLSRPECLLLTQHTSNGVTSMWPLMIQQKAVINLKKKTSFSLSMS